MFFSVGWTEQVNDTTLFNKQFKSNTKTNSATVQLHFYYYFREIRCCGGGGGDVGASAVKKLAVIFYVEYTL